MKVSIVVPVWNHFKDLTKPFIETLVATTSDVEYELIVVDNGSTDGTEEYLKRMKTEYPVLKPIFLEKNLGFGGGSNEGYKKATGEYVCFISNDVIPKDPQWLKKLVDGAQENSKAMYGDRMVDYNELTIFNHVPTPYITGYLMFATKEVFELVKEDDQVFDVSFGKAYFEDVELSERVRLKGYDLIQIDDLGIEHLGSKSSDQIDISETTKTAQRYFLVKMKFLHLKHDKKKRIVFHFKCPYPFDDRDYEGKGVGGAEASLILLAREFAKNDWVVDVYNSTKTEGTYNGVAYHNVISFNPREYSDVFVLFRTPERFLKHVNAKQRIFWSCDQYTIGNWRSVIFPYVNKIIAISPYHKKYLEARYGPMEKKIDVIDLGINVPDYEKEVEKVPGKMIFCSVPRRGLEHMQRYFMEIKKRVPHASLYITSDYRLWGIDDPDNAEFREKFRLFDSVFFLGKISRKELVEHQNTAEVMTYSCDYEECFCISAMECVASGATPVSTRLGALESTIGESGVLINGMPGEREYDKQFIDATVKLLTEKNPYREEGRKRALTKYSMKNTYSQWISLLEGGDNMAQMYCPEEDCKKKMPNDFVLQQHMVKAHGAQPLPEGDDNTDDYSAGGPLTQLLKFNLPVRAQINGKVYQAVVAEDAYEVEVEEEVVPSFMDIVSNGYPDAKLVL